MNERTTIFKIALLRQFNKPPLSQLFMEKLNEETRKEIEQARAEINAGKFYTHEQVKKKLGIKN